MAGFGGNNSSGRRSSKDRDVNTNGFMLRNEELGKFMKVDYFNKCMTIAIGVIPPNSGQYMDFQTLRESTSVNQTLVFTQMFEFRDVMDDISHVIKGAGTFKPTAIAAGAVGDCMVEISDGSNIDQQPGIYFVIYKDMDATSGRAGRYDFYPLSDGTVFRGYNPKTGQRTIETLRGTQFKAFREAIRESCAAFTMAKAHTIQETGKYERMQNARAMASIAAGMGVDLTQDVRFSNNNSNNGYGRQSSGGGQGGGYQQAAPWAGGSNTQSNNNNRAGVFESDGIAMDDINLDMPGLSHVSFGDMS